MRRTGGPHSLELFGQEVLEQDLLFGLELQQAEEQAHEWCRRLTLVHAANGVQGDGLVDDGLGWRVSAGSYLLTRMANEQPNGCDTIGMPMAASHSDAQSG